MGKSFPFCMHHPFLYFFLWMQEVSGGGGVVEGVVATEKYEEGGKEKKTQDILYLYMIFYNSEFSRLGK